MAQTYAVVDASTRVVNVILAEPGFELDGYVLVASEAGKIGDTYDAASGTFATPHPSMSALRAARLAGLAAKRWQVETGGLTLLGGIPIFTDDRSKLMITGARIKADKDPTFTTKWVGADGTRTTINAATIIAISDAVLAHVDACFDRFDALAAQIEIAADVTALAAIDIESGWPS